MIKRITDVNEAYELAKSMAARFAKNHTLPSLQYEDYVQEAMLGWHTNRNMYYAMVDAFRKAAPLSYSAYIKNPSDPPYPKFVSIVEWLDADRGTTEQIDACDNALFADQVKRYILTHIQDDAMQVALISYLFLGASMYKIACMLRRSQDRVSKLLNEGVAILKEAVRDGGIVDIDGNSGSCVDCRGSGAGTQPQTGNSGM